MDEQPTDQATNPERSPHSGVIAETIINQMIEGDALGGCWTVVDMHRSKCKSKTSLLRGYAETLRHINLVH